MRRLFEATDLDAVEHVLPEAYGRVRLAVTGGRTALRLESSTLGPIRFDRVDSPGSFHADVDALRAYVFGQLCSGRIRFGPAGRAREFRAGNVFLPAPPGIAHTADVENGAFDLAVIPFGLFDELVQTDGAGPPPRPRPVHFTTDRSVAVPDGERWVAACAFLRDVVAADSEASAQPLIVGNAVRLLLATTLATFPNTFRTDPTAADRTDGHRRTLRRAIGYIESHPDRPITVVDVARAAHVTTRTVEIAFRRGLGTTPTAYLRRVRLDRAHTDLRAATPDTATVTQIARRWGYARPSRFAADYRAAYGCLPHQTLRA